MPRHGTEPPMPGRDAVATRVWLLCQAEPCRAPHLTAAASSGSASGSNYLVNP